MSDLFQFAYPISDIDFEKAKAVVGYTNKGYAVLEGGDIQEVKLLRVLEE